MKAYRFRVYPTKFQAKAMYSHLWASKELWNRLLDYSKTFYEKTGKFPSKTELQAMTKNSGLHSQAAQAVAHRLHRALKRVGQMRRLGVKAGFPRFKNIDRLKSLYYPQSGFKLGNKKLKVTPFGEIVIRKHREIDGKIKTLTLKRQSSGKWFAVFTAEQEPVDFKSNGKKAVGVDLGLKSFAVLSDSSRIANPRFYEEKQEQLAFLQREVSRKKKGGRNRAKAKVKIARLCERISDSRNDFLHRQSRRLVSGYGLIALEKLGVKGMMAEQKFGKQINDASWAQFASMVSYKAASAGCRTVFVNPSGTSKKCSECGLEQEMPLFKREFVCPACEMILDRDLNAAINILARATAGMAGRNAWGDDTKAGHH